MSFLFSACACISGPTRPLPPPAPPGVGAPRIRSEFSDPITRRRVLFDTLAHATEEGTFLGRGSFSSVGDQVISLARLGLWLSQPTNAAYVLEIWDVVGVDDEAPPPASTARAIRAILEVFGKMGDASRTGVVHFELFTRFVNSRRVKSAASAADGSSGAESNVVGLDPREVDDAACVAVLQLKELRNLAPDEGSKLCPDPYLKLTLRCPKVEARHGRQPKVTSENGSVANVVWDPPEFLGFVVDPFDLSRAKVHVTVMDKNAITADTVLGTTVIPLKTFGAAASPPPSSSSSSSSAVTAGAGAGAGAGAAVDISKVLNDPNTGEPTGITLTVGIQIVPKEQGFGFGVEKVFELERWAVAADPPWGSTGKHLLKTDPGKWCDSSGRFFHWSLDEASRSLPLGWTAQPWRASSGFGDNGWQYSSGFRGGLTWNDSKGALSVVRRRLWYRCVSAPSASSTAAAADSTAAASAAPSSAPLEPPSTQANPPTSLTNTFTADSLPPKSSEEEILMPHRIGPPAMPPPPEAPSVGDYSSSDEEPPVKTAMVEAVQAPSEAAATSSSSSSSPSTSSSSHSFALAPNEVALAFSPSEPIGMEIAGVTLAVTTVAQSGQADELGVGVGWRVHAVGGVPVRTLGAYKKEMEKAIAAAGADAPILSGGAAAAAAAVVGEKEQMEEKEGTALSGVAGLVIVFNHEGGNTTAVSKDAQNFRNSVFAGDNGGEENEYDLDSDEETGEQIEGYLLKKGVNLINPWQSRWFIAQGHYLRYYKNNGEASDPRQCQAAVDLFLCGPMTDARGKFFSVAVSGKEINLKAKSEAEASQWVESLRKIQGV